ncbi:helix-turn-helix domain-containing protein [Micromonospora sp. STR1_7]|uniref:Helix-turn-helix domain-containing protein n=1 Tax=Micromonospora parastrephiae TaxID=2806101 RepID=A0ABS1XMH3_9ACTN|nr:helix-turn-helix transcriptional regulator [Micromonospora parastrephiae]MBM0230461.1 helix-turn-helix domain-containing protein [Micromonospora parastrephiae]
MVDSDEIRSAWRDLGRTLAKLRIAAGHTQHGFAGLIQYGRSSVANTETGRQQPDRAFWMRCDAILDAEGALVKAYDTIIVHARQQRRASALRAAAPFAPGLAQAEPNHDESATDRESDSARMGLMSFVPDLAEFGDDPWQKVHPDKNRATPLSSEPSGSVSPALVPHWMGMLRILAASHDAFGPRRIHDVARGELAIIHRHGTSAEGQTLRELQRVEARWAEFASWTADNLGDGQDASYWLRRSLSLARDAGDDRMACYVLMRQAQRAAERHNVPRALTLAQASASSPNLAARDRALCAVRQAQANALAGKAAECWTALRTAQQLAAIAEDHDDPEVIGQHCGPAYVTAHVGQCHLLLGKPGRAAGILEEILRHWPSTYRQDEGMTRTWLATAYALLSRIEEAAEQAEKVLNLATETGSIRLTQALRRVDAELAGYRSDPAVHVFRARYALATQISGRLGP